MKKNMILLLAVLICIFCMYFTFNQNPQNTLFTYCLTHSLSDAVISRDYIDAATVVYFVQNGNGSFTSFVAEKRLIWYITAQVGEMIPDGKNDYQVMWGKVNSRNEARKGLFYGIIARNNVRAVSVNGIPSKIKKNDSFTIWYQFGPYSATDLEISYE